MARSRASKPDPREGDVESVYRSLLRGAALTFLGGMMFALGLAALLSRGAGSVTSATSADSILYPVFAMFLLVALVLTRMGWLRIGGVRRGDVDIAFYRTCSEGEEPEAFRVVTRHFINLFEVPVLFYVAVIFAHITHQVSCLLVGLAWSFVLLRGFHSYVHLTSNDVPMRLAAYAASGLVLVVMWATLLLQLLFGSG